MNSLPTPDAAGKPQAEASLPNAAEFCRTCTLLPLERECLHDVAVAVNEGKSLDEILLIARDAVLRLSHLDRVGLWLVDRGALRGAWGTDASGRLRDERNHFYRCDEVSPRPDELMDEARGYVIGAPDFLRGPGLFSLPNERPPARCAIPMRARGELIGLIFGDNLISGRPIDEAAIAALVPFCEQLALAVANARLLAEKEQLARRQQRFMEIAAAINSSPDLDTILRLVRDAAIDVGGFDRAGVWLVEGENIRGSWGTDAHGRPRDERHLQEKLDQWPPAARTLKSGQQRFYIEQWRTPYDDLRDEEGFIPHAVVALVTHGEMVGLLSVDNLITGRPFSEEDLLPLLPFADQAAVAIRNARLMQEVRQAQEALLRTEKLRAVGELAGGVAHNVNNVLTAVLGYAELIQQDGNATPEIRQYARVIERAALDGAEIARRMQQFAHTGAESRHTSFDLVAVTTEAIALTRPAWHNQASAMGARIDVVTEMPSRLFARGIASEIREVAVNLMKNACDAMPAGGTLTVKCYRRNGDAVLEVGDTGIGMDEQTQQRIFEPFFTTKGAGLGTGLGLAITWGIVAHHQGRINVRSAPGKGTTFTVHLPLAAQPEDTNLDRAQSEVLHGVRVLLVEDEELVAGSIARILAAQGADVAMALSGQEALEWMQKHGADCDIVLTDHGMPGMTGSELLAEVRDRYPAVRRVLISGWGRQVPNGVDTSAAEMILGKPVRQRDLTKAVASLVRRG
ncbi:MAG: ATP-binding protein [Chthonomonadales bacterium]